MQVPGRRDTPTHRGPSPAAALTRTPARRGAGAAPVPTGRGGGCEAPARGARRGPQGAPHLRRRLPAPHSPRTRFPRETSAAQVGPRRPRKSSGSRGPEPRAAMGSRIPLPLSEGNTPSLRPLRLRAWEPDPRGEAARPLPSPGFPPPPARRRPTGTPKPGVGGAPTCSELSPGRTRASEAPRAPRGAVRLRVGRSGAGLGTRDVGPARADVTASVSRAPALPGRRRARRN